MAAPPVRRRRRAPLLIGAAVVVLALVAVVLVVFQPQKLFLDQEVNEALPGLVAAAPPTTGGVGDPAGAAAPAGPGAVDGPVVVRRGTFSDGAHPTSGTALLVRQPDGSHLVRLEGLRTDNGPDLYLSVSTGAAGDYSALTNVEALKGNVGDQNYPLPSTLDAASLTNVVIWCERFSVAFGDAPLTPA